MGRMNMRRSVAITKLVSMSALKTTCWVWERRSVRCVCPPHGLGLAERGHDGGVPGCVKWDEIRKRGDDREEAGENDYPEHGVAGSSRPLKGEDGQVEQADGHLSEGQAENVAEQREPPRLSIASQHEYQMWLNMAGEGEGTSIMGE